MQQKRTVSISTTDFTVEFQDSSCERYC